jgi:hypothetical protein
MIRTETAAMSAYASLGCGPQMDQTAKARTAAAMTAGTNQADT